MRVVSRVVGSVIERLARDPFLCVSVPTPLVRMRLRGPTEAVLPTWVVCDLLSACGVHRTRWFVDMTADCRWFVR